jgi:hypothetical protein
MFPALSVAFIVNCSCLCFGIVTEYSPSIVEFPVPIMVVPTFIIIEEPLPLFLTHL